MRTTLVGLAAGLTACSLIAPRSSDQTDELTRASAIQHCTLKELEERKNLPLRVVSSGTAYAFIVRTQPIGPTNRAVTGEHALYIQIPNESKAFVGVARDGQGQLGHVVVQRDEQLLSAQAWFVSGTDFLGRMRSKNTLLHSGASIRLRAADSGHFINVDQRGAVTASSTRSRDAVTLVIYKADVPDATHPATCDAIIRDGDYVFLGEGERRPHAWLGVDHDGALRAGREPPAVDATSESATSINRICLDEKEVCYNDSDGLLYCAWVPSCVR